MIVIVLWIILISLLMKLLQTTIADKNARLSTNGYQVIDCLSESDVNHLKSLWDANETNQMKTFIHQNPKVLGCIQTLIGPKYSFQDYIFLIEKSKIHTCHRDNNSHVFNKDQKHPSYTIIFYLEPMNRCLDVIDKSSKSQMGIYLTDATKSIKCNPGNAILFDANLIHSGSMNDKENHRRIQMKLTHVDDLETISFFQDYNKKLDEPNNNTMFVTKLQKHFSCQVPIISDLFKNDAAKPIEKIFSKLFYGNENFYNLKDIGTK